MQISDWLSYRRKAGLIYTRLCQPICQGYGVNQTELEVLTFISNNPEFNTARDTCEQRGLKTGIASVAIQSLIARGFLLCKNDTADRRIKRLSLTEKATPLIQEERIVRQNYVKALTESVSPEDLRAFQTIIQQFVTNIDRLLKEGK